MILAAFFLPCFSLNGRRSVEAWIARWVMYWKSKNTPSLLLSRNPACLSSIPHLAQNVVPEERRSRRFPFADDVDGDRSFNEEERGWERRAASRARGTWRKVCERLTFPLLWGLVLVKRSSDFLVVQVLARPELSPRTSIRRARGGA